MTFPNQLSILRIILSPVFYFMFLSDNVTLKRFAILIYFIATLTDWYDGWHARRFKSITKFGIFIDPLADKILTSFSFALFVSLNIVPLWMVIIIIGRDIIITFLRSLRELKGSYFKTSFLAKTKTFIQMSYIFLILIILLVLTFDIDLNLRNQLDNFIRIDNPANYILMLVVTLLTIYTGISYFFEKKPAK
jgi:CDP-diacylglycerol---glycerol-3-phosphate 3-phosphatidyltransferase